LLSAKQDAQRFVIVFGFYEPCGDLCPAKTFGCFPSVIACQNAIGAFIYHDWAILSVCLSDSEIAPMSP
jgi:hypothetical protein